MEFQRAAAGHTLTLTSTGLTEHRGDEWAEITTPPPHSSDIPSPQKLKTSIALNGDALVVKLRPSHVRLF